jgi:hypothetical protein
MSKIQLKKSLFQRFLKGISTISDTTILTIKDGEMYSLSSSEDNALYLYAKMITPSEDVVLNIPSVSKLEKAINLINNEDLTFTINKNHIDYKSDGLKFKYHLLDNGVLTAAKLSVAKIQSFEFQTSFNVSTKFLKNLLKQSTLTGTDKVYIYTEDGYLYWKLGDDTKPNSDSIIVKSNEIDFEFSPFIMKTTNLNLVAGFSEEITFKISNQGVGCVLVDLDDLTLQYILAKLSA